jgi:glutaconate CoA-transferase, subunit B
MDGRKRFASPGFTDTGSLNMNETSWTADELITIVGARQFRDRTTSFVGVGLPSMAACLARQLFTPDMVLIYESGAIGAKPTVAPLSIADCELAETADCMVSVPELFSYWLQGGRIQMALLGAGQIDRFGNLNSTVIGDYDHPKVRLPGAGGAPEIASFAGEVVVLLRQSPKAFVSKVDFVSTATGRRKNLKAVVTDLGVLVPDPETGELVLTARHPGVSSEQIRQATGWPLRFAPQVLETPPPMPFELAALRDLDARTKQAHEAEPLIIRPTAA